MKLSEFIKKYGDCKVTDKIKECIVKKQKTVWDLKNGDVCYGLNKYYNIKKITWEENNILMGYVRDIGLITLTAEELEFKLETMKVYEELKRFAKEFTYEDWYKQSVHKYYLYANYDPFGCYIDICIEESYLHKNSGLYFESKEKAREAIKAVGKERVKKYYLGVGK